MSETETKIVTPAENDVELDGILSRYDDRISAIEIKSTVNNMSVVKRVELARKIEPGK